MARRSTIEELEQRLGRPLTEVIPELYAELKDLNAVAKQLGISRTALWYCRLRLGINRSLATKQHQHQA